MDSLLRNSRDVGPRDLLHLLERFKVHLSLVDRSMGSRRDSFDAHHLLDFDRVLGDFS